MPESIAYNMDCLEYMRSLPDKYFDLCVADPPYGAGFTEGGGCKGWFTKYHQDAGNDSDEGLVDRHNLRGRFSKYDYEPTISAKRIGGDGGGWKNSTYGKKIIAWDVMPEPEVFNEMFRISRNQIIWGGNYFGLPPTRCFLIWRKLSISESFTMAMAEYAWTSFNSNAKVFECAPQGKADDPRFHPCLPTGTMVHFNKTWKPIESVRVGDKNRFGTVSAITEHDAEKMVCIAVGEKTVTATWNHPFLVKRQNGLYWVNAEQINEGDELLSLWKRDMQSQTKGICATEQTENGYEWSIVWFGKKTMGRFLTVCKSIIRTLTRPITIFPISSLSHPLSISGCTKVADLSTAFGISHANAVESSKPSRKKTGISIKKQGGSLLRVAALVMSRKLSKNAVCVSQTVGSVKIINEKTKVYNLSIDGIPAFETEIGITHNTQKPIDLYRWIYGLYTEPGQKIFDPYLGSGSSRIAAWEMGLDFVGCEIDPIYFEKEEERFARHTAQYSLFN